MPGIFCFYRGIRIKRKEENKMKKLVSLILVFVIAVSVFTSCKKDGKTDFTVGICNYVDDASLNQIVANIKSQLTSIAQAKNKTIKIIEKNCNADSGVLSQIITEFKNSKVDLMVAVATPVAIAMQAATEDDRIPVVFAAVSDPLGAGLVKSLDAPGSNLTGTSDYLDTKAIMDLIFAKEPAISKVGLLYDVGQDSSTAAIKEAKTYLAAKGVEVKEYTGTNTSEIVLQTDKMVSDGITALFTPSDNTVMTAELSIYEKLAENGILHYAGADSFALNGAFLGYGVDYANLGRVTADMAAEILIDGKDPATLAVRTFDNGTATVNTDICEKLGLDYDAVAELFKPYCTKVQPIKTAAEF